MNIRSSLFVLLGIALVPFRAGAQIDEASGEGAAPPSHPVKSPSDSAANGATATKSPTPDASSGIAHEVTPPNDSSHDVASENEGAQQTRAAVETENGANAERAEERESTLDGDESGTANGAGKLRFMLQLRYKHTYVDSVETDRNALIAQQQRGTLKEQDGYDIQRALLRYTARPSKYVAAKFLVDFAELRHENVRQSFKLAYLQMHPTKRLEIDVGLLKRTYSILELLPIVDHELADLGPSDSYIKDAGYGGRDIGGVVRYRPLPKRSSMMVSLGMFRGDLDEGYDSHPLKVVTVRIEGYPWKHLRLGINGAWRPYDNVQMKKLEDAEGDKYYGQVVTLNRGAAVGADATLLFKRLQVRAEGLYGDRTDVGRPMSANRFVSAWVVIAPNFRLGPVKFVPAGKFEMLDLNAQEPGGRRLLFTGVIGVVPVKNLRMLIDVTRTKVERLTPALSNVPWTSGNSSITITEPSSTSGTLQVQYVF